VDVEGLTVKRDLAGRAYSLGYKDEEPYDRDRHGVLWNRMVSSPGVGRPHFASMHSHRQRRAMLGLLCQVCGGPADRTSRGWLFMTERDEKTQSSPHWPEGSLTTKPPVCGSCAEVALRYCPHLKDPVFIRSRKPRVWGVFGGFFTLTPANVLATSDDAYLPYGAPESPWFLAALVAVELTRCTLPTRAAALPRNRGTGGGTAADVRRPTPYVLRP
jgi:hypothetical protein